MDEHTSVGSQGERDWVRAAYQRLATVYDTRVPGTTAVDARFGEVELSFLLDRITSSDTVLDIGCGTGRLTVPIAEKAAHTTGLDFSDAMLEMARKRAEAQGVDVELITADMVELPFPDGSFDVVVSMLALMHIPPSDRRRVFLEISRVLKPGGRAMVGVKNARFEQLSRADRFASVDVTDVDNQRLIFTRVGDDEQLEAPWHSFSPQDLNRLFAVAGLIVVELRGNVPLMALLSDAVLADPRTYAGALVLEELLASVPPFNHFGYHLLAEAVKPA